MNEQIRAIAEQAAYDTRKEHNNAYWRMQDEIAEDATWREKFAELIVFECVETLKMGKKCDPLTGEWLDTPDNVVIDKHIGWLIRQFGVDE